MYPGKELLLFSGILASSYLGSRIPVSKGHAMTRIPHERWKNMEVSMVRCKSSKSFNDWRGDASIGDSLGLQNPLSSRSCPIQSPHHSPCIVSQSYPHIIPKKIPPKKLDGINPYGPHRRIFLLSPYGFYMGVPKKIGRPPVIIPFRWSFSSKSSGGNPPIFRAGNPQKIFPKYLYRSILSHRIPHVIPIFFPFSIFHFPYPYNIL